VGIGVGVGVGVGDVVCGGVCLCTFAVCLC